MSSKMQAILDKAKAKAAKSGGYSKSVKPYEGKSAWRILPGWRKDEPEEFYHAYGQHYIKQNKSAKPSAVITCADKTHDQECEICAMINAASSGATKEEGELLSEMRASQRFLVNAIDRKSGKVVVLDLGVGLFNSLIESLGEYEDLLDPAEGQDIVINREGKGIDTKYTLTVRPPSKSEAVLKSQIMEINDLDKFVAEADEENMKKAVKALGLVINKTGAAAGALTGPKARVVSDDFDDLDDEEVMTRAREIVGSPLDDALIDDAEFEDIPEEPKAKSKPKAASKPKEETVTVSGLDDISDEELDGLFDDLEDE